MTLAAQHVAGPSISDDGTPAQTLARQLARAGLGVEICHHRDTWQFTILGVSRGKSFVALENSGQARWYYEPAPGSSSAPATLTEIIAYLFSAPSRATSLAVYRALPLKGQVGRSLQDRGLTVALRVSEDLESFEATTDIDITSPSQPQLGTVTLSDDAALDWHCNWRTAFPGNPAAMSAASWKPGTSRWAYLNTGVYLILFAVGLPLAAAVHTESGWVLFSIVMLAGVCNTAGAWLGRRHARRTTPAAPVPAPHH